MRSIIVAAALLGLLLVAAGAAGAHTIPLDANRQWQSALLYGFVHTLAAIVAAILPLCFLASWGAAKLPGISALSAGTRTILLTVVIAGAAALLFPVKEDEEAADEA